MRWARRYRPVHTADRQQRSGRSFRRTCARRRSGPQGMRHQDRTQGDRTPGESTPRRSASSHSRGKSLTIDTRSDLADGRRATPRSCRLLSIGHRLLSTATVCDGVGRQRRVDHRAAIARVRYGFREASRGEIVPASVMRPGTRMEAAACSAAVESAMFPSQDGSSALARVSGGSRLPRNIDQRARDRGLGAVTRHLALRVRVVAMMTQ